MKAREYGILSKHTFLIKNEYLKVGMSEKAQRVFENALKISIVLSAVLVATLAFGKDRKEVLESAGSAVATKGCVVIDAGHGGEDPGAIGKNGIYEKDVNLSIVMEMGRLLEEKGYVVLYTRTDDRLLYKDEENIKGIRKISDLKNRCSFANKYPEAVFVSIHMNSFGDQRYSGLQVYYSEKNEKSREVADKIQSKVAADLQPDNKRKIKAGKGIYVLENTTIPAVLIECGFLSNPEECEKLSEKEYQKRLSFSIVCAIIEYMED
jgi:N-acetylmuramoyl-L-alanine amidase